MILTKVIVLLLGITSLAQSSPGVNYRPLFSVMVVPYTSGSENPLARIESDPGYRNAISDINNELIRMGYSNTLDFKTYKEATDKQHGMQEGKTWSEKINLYIENAPVDLVIRTEITWIDPPGNPRDRQVKIRLTAIDKYTSAVYADNATIQSAQREYPDMAAAVLSALSKDGNIQFKDFLEQLDNSYSGIITNGRQVAIQFAIDRENSNDFSEVFAGGELRDTIEAFVRRKALNGRYTLSESDSYLSFKVVIPVIDEAGRPQTPTWFITREISGCFRKWHYRVSLKTIGNWIIFTLLKDDQ